MSYLSNRNPAHRQRIGTSASYIMLKTQMRSTCLCHSQYKPLVAILLVELNGHTHKALTSKPRRNGRIIGMLPDIRILPQALFLVGLHPRGLGPTESVGASLRVSNSVCPSSRSQGADRDSVANFLCMVVFYHFLELTNPSNSRGSSV